MSFVLGKKKKRKNIKQQQQQIKEFLICNSSEFFNIIFR